MAYPTIEKDPSLHEIVPNLTDYDRVCSAFSWVEERRELLGDDDGCMNIARLAVDRHAEGECSGRTAIRWLGTDGSAVDLSYQALCEATSRFANVLDFLQVGRGQTVFSLTGRTPLLYVAAFGTLKHRSVFCPLFEQFGPEPILQRLSQGDCSTLVTTSHAFRRKIEPILSQLPLLRHILLVDVENHGQDRVWSLSQLLREASPVYEIPPTGAEEPALLHFTSGTTSLPKGVLHVHEAVIGHYVTAKYVLDFHAGDIFWCTADPGWVMGAVYSMIAPLVHGITSVADEAEFSVARWLQILTTENINVLYTSPTALRRFMRLPEANLRQYSFPSLRAIHSAGEPLVPEAVVWGQRVLGLPLHDNWWQTETGSIMIANYPAMKIRPGSMGRPIPGINAAVVRTSDSGAEPITEPDTPGLLALKPGWPSMFRTYLHDEQKYLRTFSGGWYLTGDLARIDADGYFWFIGRADDMIKTAGHLVGPFEVESCLVTHPAVLDVGIFGKPDPILGEQVTACIVVRSGYTPDDRLRDDVIAFGRKQLGSAVAPREIIYVADIPKTRSGKVLRRLLKSRELGLPEGDLSTLEKEEDTHSAYSDRPYGLTGLKGDLP